MITEEERQSIINEAVEKALLLLPEVVGNLIVNQTKLLKLNRSFYEKYPDFAKNKELVASIVEKVEGTNPGMKYEDILSKSVPLIRERLSTAKGLDFKLTDRPNRDLSSLNVKDNSHGEL